jgi:hypothetical protein
LVLLLYTMQPGMWNRPSDVVTARPPGARMRISKQALWCPWSMHMQPRITVITLGADDLERSLRLYRDGLGLPTAGILGVEFEYGAVAFFAL